MAKTKRLEPQVIAQIKSWLEDSDLNAEAIRLEVGVSKRTIERMRLSFDLFGAPYPPFAKRTGRPRALTAAQSKWLLTFLEEQPTAYLDEMALAISDQFEVDISEKTVHRELQRARWSRKVVKAKARERDAVLRSLWPSIIGKYPVESLVFVDESAAHERTGDRKRGWSPEGQSCSVIRSLHRSERWSILPALTINGYLPEPLIIKGSVTREIFVWWLINRVVPYLPPGSVIVMDNAKIHHNLGLEEWLQIRGIKIEYLPPYSPDFNPIENTFATLKAWLKRHVNEAKAAPDFRCFLEKAVSDSVGLNASNYFKGCGYY